MMPQKNGWEFLEELRMPGNQVLPKHRVVTISAVRASLSLEDPISLEVDGVIRKPLDVDRILDEAQKYCVPCGQKT
jgi:DNA-binding NarL/FixJ family response regulator